MQHFLGKTYEIWCEGFAVTGNTGQAQLLGTSSGVDFINACNKFFLNTRDGHLYECRGGQPSFWGCRLFDNEADARRNFG